MHVRFWESSVLVFRYVYRALFVASRCFESVESVSGLILITFGVVVAVTEEWKFITEELEVTEHESNS